MKWLRENVVVLGTFGAFVAFAMTVLATKADIVTMTSSLATKADVAALPTRADIVTMTSSLATKADVAVLPTRAEVADTVRDLRETVAALGLTVQELNNTVIALSGSVDLVNAAAVRMDGAVESLGGRVDYLSGVVSPLVPCIIALHQRLEQTSVAERQIIDLGFQATIRSLPPTCVQAQDRAAFASNNGTIR